MIDFTQFDSDEKIVKAISSHNGQLRNIRKFYEGLWDVEAKLFLPRRYDLLRQAMKGQKYGAKVYDGHPANAVNKFVLGLQGNMISRSVPWLQFTTSNQRLLNNDEVKKYLQESTEQVLWSFNRSNFYGSSVWQGKDACTFGTGAMVPEIDMAKGRIVYHTVHPGESWIADDQYGSGAVYQREFKMAAITLLEKFGADKLPSQVLRDAQGKGQGQPFTEYKCLLAIYKNVKPNPDSLLPEDKPYKVFYILESGAHSKKDSLLQKSGMDWFPLLWRQGREDGLAYGTSIAADALTEGLQVNQIGKKQLELLAIAIEGRWLIHENLRNKFKTNPGGRTYFAKTDEDVRPLSDKAQNWPLADDYAERIHSSIDDKFFIRFFELLSSGEFKNITAYQASQMLGEKASLMSAIVGEYEEHVLEPAVDIQFAFEQMAGRMPQPPDILLEEGGKVDISYIGPLAQMQRAVMQSKGIVNALPLMQAIGAIWPQALVKINEMELIEDAGISQGMKQTYFKSDEEVKAILEQQAARQEAMENAEMAGNMAKAAGPMGKQIEAGSPLDAMMG